MQASKKPSCVPYAQFVPIDERLVGFIDLTDGCWLWLGHCNAKGYGRFRDGLAHRVVYETFVEPVPPSLQLDHLCRVRRCVNPDHLELVTNAENQRRGLRAKITEADAAAIRASTATNRELMARYGISRATVQRVRNSRSWT